MFRKLRQWFAANQAWRQAHEAAWRTSALAGPDGLSPFQRQASEQLCAALGALAFQRHGQSETYLLAELPSGNASVFIYVDGAQIHAESRALFVAEREDYATPAELIQRFVAAARGVAA